MAETINKKLVVKLAYRRVEISGEQGNSSEISYHQTGI